MTRHVYIKTFGCQMNERDSEIIVQMLARSGYIWVDDMAAADLILLNTCSIRAKAEQKVYSLLGQLREEKSRRPGLRIGVAGCVAQQEGKEIFRRMAHVDLVLGTRQIQRLPGMLERLDQGESERELAVDMEPGFTIPPFQKLLVRDDGTAPSPAGHGDSDFKKFVTIMQGCNNYCSYCVVPATRGREVSRPVADILEEVRLLVNRGVREITLLGQNVNSYGWTNSVADRPTSFADLLCQVAAVPGLERLRFTTSNPRDLSGELMRCFAELDNLCPQLHLPVQSGSDRILRRMNRRYTVATYLERVEGLRAQCPDIALTTDIIVGFPGETDEDFEATLELLRTVRYHGSFSFKYSDRPNTRSAEFADKVPEEVKGERLQRFQSLQDEISLERNKEYIDKTVDVMVEEQNGTSTKGRTVSNHIVHFETGQTLRPGQHLEVRITRAGKHSLRGEPVSGHRP